MVMFLADGALMSDTYNDVNNQAIQTSGSFTFGPNPAIGNSWDALFAASVIPGNVLDSANVSGGSWHGMIPGFTEYWAYVSAVVSLICVCLYGAVGSQAEAAEAAETAEATAEAPAAPDCTTDAVTAKI